MIWEQPHYQIELERENSPQWTNKWVVEYCFMKPAVLTIKDTAGVTKKMSYGVGEKVKVYQPATVYCIPGSRMKKQVVMEDGNMIVGWPDDLHVIRER